MLPAFITSLDLFPHNIRRPTVFSHCLLRGGNNGGVKERSRKGGTFIIDERSFLAFRMHMLTR